MCLGSGIRKKPIPDPGPGVKNRTPDPDTQHFFFHGGTLPVLSPVQNSDMFRIQFPFPSLSIVIIKQKDNSDQTIHLFMFLIYRYYGET